MKKGWTLTLLIGMVAVAASLSISKQKNKQLEGEQFPSSDDEMIQGDCPYVANHPYILHRRGRV